MTAESSRLSITVDSERSVTVDGVIDSHTSGQLLERLTELGTEGDVTVGMAGVAFIDSSGLRTIVTVHQELAEAGRRLVLDGVSQPVNRLLEITGLHEHLNLQ